MTAAIPAPGAFNQPAAGGQPVRALPDAHYGQQTAYQQQQQAAPLANSDSSAIAPPPAPSQIASAGPPQQALGPAGLPMAPQQMQPPTPLNAPTQRPGEPITSGVPVGPGPNSLQGVPGQANPSASLKDALAPYFAADTTGVLAAVANTLASRGMW